MSLKAATALVMLGAVCRPAVPTEEPSPEPSPEEPAPLEPETPTNREAGESLDAAVPLLGGGALDLSSLRGRVVLLEISASWDESWDDAHELYAELGERHGDRIAVIVVANDEDPSRLEEDAMGPLVIGWDPHGALAARLRLAGFPTVLVLDADGKITLIRRGFDDAIAAEVRAELERLLAG